jgi:hypothetical protein
MKGIKFNVDMKDKKKTGNFLYVIPYIDYKPC